MTAVNKYQLLEASGLWRTSIEAQRRDVLLSLGQATLTISDRQETALAHWSLPAIKRLNPGERPALFAPGEDTTEELETDDDTLIRALEKVRTVVARRRPHPGRLRYWLMVGTLVGAVVLGLFWVPGALRSYTASVVPDPTRQAIGQRILTRIDRIAGRQCNASDGRGALDRLTQRVLGNNQHRVIVLSGGVQQATHLPGRITLLNRALIEDYEEPDVVAGFLLAEDTRRQQSDPIMALLEHAGLRATARLLTTGDLPDPVVDSYAEQLLIAERTPLNNADLIDRFAETKIRSTPYAYALDQTGERTLDLIEADPVPVTNAVPLLSDTDWVILQGICGE